MLSKYFCILIFLIYIFKLAFSWKYSNNNDWPRLFKTCSGGRQSPIDIDKSKVKYSTHLLAFEMPGYETIPRGAHWVLQNNGNILQILLSGDYKVREGGLGGEYKALRMELHWGTETENGAEHWYNGTQYPMELQIYHFNTKYGSYDDAVNQPDGLAAFSFFIKIKENDNSIFTQIINKLPNVLYKGQQVVLRPVPILSMLPINLNNYYRYDGSLTHPPCSEIVTWTVFKEFIDISHAQLKAFTTSIKFSNVPATTNKTTLPMRQTYRNLQPLHDRTILSSLSEDATFWTSPLSPISITLAILFGFILLFLVLGKQPKDIYEGACVTESNEAFDEEDGDTHID